MNNIPEGYKQMEVGFIPYGHNMTKEVQPIDLDKLEDHICVF